jgi:hypothetical protein
MYRAERVSPKPKQTEGAERKKVFSEGSICMMRMGLSVGFIVQTIRKNKVVIISSFLPLMASKKSSRYLYRICPYCIYLSFLFLELIMDIFLPIKSSKRNAVVMRQNYCKREALTGNQDIIVGNNNEKERISVCVYLLSFIHLLHTLY